ncbi:urea amidolyase [Paramyrothecium foliicola]|nr:urea amidolyase [Paramyrothecium foliicola]
MDSVAAPPLNNIQKVLVANRGEIAVRCIKACRELGVKSVAIVTNADATSLHAALADETVTLPGDDSSAYTNGQDILAVCKRTGADAIIPGYGFLSENVEFARAAQDAGITFVGPSSASINAMGLKHEARAIAEAAQVPVIPGTQLLASAAEATRAAKALGFPVMLKATGGGGGMGLQICQDENEVNQAFAMVESRASTLFQNSGVFLEKYYSQSRHVEVQVAGNGEIVVAFGERECSLQRRHQKVIEECPSPFVERHSGLREKMLAAAVAYASRLHYKSVGTVEFLVDDQTADFFFLEMNTRLQVEHGITEMCYGVDLVHLMLRQADYERGGHSGMPSDMLRSLGRSQPLGSAIEARLYAEVPLRDFAPSPGVLQYVKWPHGDGVRVDTWVKSGQRITPYYDPLIAKVMAHSPDGRAAARDKMLAALGDTTLQGTQSNLEYLLQILESDIFTAGNTLTNSLATFNIETCSAQIIDPGVYTTVQDLPGRADTGHGIPPGGPMDDLSAQVANILVGNAPGVELLEATLAGPEILFHQAAVVAVCGAALPITIDGIEQPMWSRLVVRKGQTLRLGKIYGDGVRTYLAVAGGFPQVPVFLGSKSTAPELGFGGVQGRKLQRHDLLALSKQSAALAEAATAFTMPAEAVPQLLPTSVRCIHGPYGSEDILTPEGIKTLYSANWVVTHNSSRSGIRLDGPRLQWARKSGGGGGSHPSNVFDYGYPDGGVNFTGEFPVIFGRDRPDLGGFVCPTTICSGDMWKVGQLKPGNTVRFRCVSFEDSLRITEQKHVYLKAVTALSNGRDCQIPSHDVMAGLAPPNAILRLTAPSGSRPKIQYRQGGDGSIIIEFGVQKADLRNTACVHLFLQHLSAAKLPSVRGEPNFAALIVRFDPFKIARSEVFDRLVSFESLIKGTEGVKIPTRRIRLPLCLDHSALQASTEAYMQKIRPTAAYLPDNVEYLRKNNALSTRQEVFDSLLKTPWLTVAVGFFVGTPICFPLDPRHVMTGQKYNPSRVSTPRGTIGLGGSLTAIYPVESSGGYQLMGRTLGGWDAACTRPGFSAGRPWLFKHLDLVEFQEVTEEEYDRIGKDFDAGRHVFNISNTTLDLDQYIARFEAAAKDPAHQAWEERQLAASEELIKLEKQLFADWTAEKAASQEAAAEGDQNSKEMVNVEAPMDANVWKVQVKVGDVLTAGQTIAILEAMKMEINVVVSEEQAGSVVVKIVSPPGSVVTPGTVIVRAQRKK